MKRSLYTAAVAITVVGSGIGLFGGMGAAHAAIGPVCVPAAGKQVCAGTYSHGSGYGVKASEKTPGQFDATGADLGCRLPDGSPATPSADLALSVSGSTTNIPLPAVLNPIVCAVLSAVSH